MGLPIQLAEVDPIVASHCGGVAGILTAQRMAESNKQVGGGCAVGGAVKPSGGDTLGWGVSLAVLDQLVLMCKGLHTPGN
jgi:hypothetical protein